MLPNSSTPKTQYWSLSQNAEGLLDLSLSLSGLSAEDVASQLEALLEITRRRASRINLDGAKDQPAPLVDPWAKDQPRINQGSTEGSTEGSTTEFSLAEAIRTLGKIRNNEG